VGVRPRSQSRKALTDQVLERSRKQRRVVERLRTHDFKADSSRELAETNINVVKNLDVVAEKADRLNHDR
jgi:RNA-splicing ligase RtcB